MLQPSLVGESGIGGCLKTEVGSRFTVSVFDKEMRESDKRHGSQLSSASGRGGGVLSAAGGGMSQFSFGE